MSADCPHQIPYPVPLERWVIDPPEWRAVSWFRSAACEICCPTEDDES